MIRTKANTFLLAAVACVAVANTACDGMTEMTVSEQLINCSPGTMRLEGTLDGMSISISQTSSGGGWAQAGGGEFGSQDNAIREASLVDVELRWDNDISVGRSTNAAGTIVMPTGGVFAGETFCAGEGSIVHSGQDGELQWLLKNITGGGGCVVPVAGELRGCFQ